MNLNDLILKTTMELCKGQESFLFEFPKRENITSYDKKLDLYNNVDFALWELEYQGKF